MSLIRKHVAVLQAWACLDLVNTEKSVGGEVKKSITSSFFNRITWQLDVEHFRE